MKPEIKSRVARGRIRHRRFHPFTRTFEHDVTYFYLDLAEIPSLFRYPPLLTHGRWGFASFQPKNLYRDDAHPELEDALRSRVERELQFRPNGPIRILTQLAYWGYGFNPVSFYYFFDDQEKLLAVLSEITNTPWAERHAYVLDLRDRQINEFDKIFHVSPFLDMNYRYSWGFSRPANSIQIHMDNLATSNAQKHFDATLSLRLTPWTRSNVATALLRQPWMTFKTVALIYIHAGILWIRRAPFFSNPGPARSSTEHQEKRL